VKFSFAILIVLLAVPLTVHGHSEIIFPRLFPLAELPTTGFAVLNPDSIPASVSFFLITATGSSVVSGAPPTFQIPPGGQLTKLGSELFPAAPAGGWVYAVTDTEGTQGFWLNFDAGMTFLDGAEAAQLDTIGPDQVIPLVAGQAELNVINPNGIRVPVTIRLFGETGELAPAFTSDLPIAGGLQAQVSAIFPLAEMAQARYIRIRSAGAPIGSLLLIRDFLVTRESAVVNGANIQARAELNFPHVVSGRLTGSNYTTVLSVTNLSATPQTVSITFHPIEGNAVSVNQTIAANGSFRLTAQSLFNLPPEFQSGWVNIRGTAVLTAVAAYADVLSGSLAIVTASPPENNLFLMHIAEGEPQWQTGLALLNSSESQSSAEVYALSPSGSLIGRTTLFLNPGTNMASVIHELIPQTRGLNGGFVYVRTLNGVPLSGVALFYTEDQKVMSNVAAGKLIAGVVYTPPVQ
jgi:hypothetical protein